MRGTDKWQKKPLKGINTPRGLRIGIFWKPFVMIFSMEFKD
jgi:hypothetical protein